MAREYLEVRTEMAYLSRYLKKLEEKLNNTEQQRQEIQQLVNEKVISSITMIANIYKHLTLLLK